jgi:hypothetical protein
VALIAAENQATLTPFQRRAGRPKEKAAGIRALRLAGFEN